MTLAYPYLYGTNIPGAGQGSVATVTNGSRIVTGTGGAWTSALEQGDLFLTGGAIGLVEEIISDTELRLALNWTGANITNGAYVAMRGIAHTDPRNYGRKLGEYLALVRELPDPGGIGDVFGPSGGVVNNEVVLFDATTGKKIKASNGVTARARGNLQVDGQLDVLGPNLVMRGAANTNIRFRNADGSLQNAVIYWDSINRRIAIAINNPDGVTVARQFYVGENLLWNDGSVVRTILHSGNLDSWVVKKTGGEITGDLSVGGEFTYGKAKNITGTDLDTLTVPGFYDGNNLTNAPNGNSGWFYIEVQRHSVNGNFVLQRATALNHSGYATWVRNRNAGVWEPWRQVWDSQTFNPASKLNVSGGELTGSLLAIGALYAKATASDNAHVWLRNADGKNRGLLYWDRNTGVVVLRVYADDGNGNDIAVGTLALNPNGTMTFNGNVVWNISHKATADQFRSGATNRILTSDNFWAAADYVSMSSTAGLTLAAGTYTPNFNAGINFFNVLGGNITIANPINAKPGQTGMIVLQQDATGGRTVAFGSAWKFANNTVPPMDTAAYMVNVIAYQVLHSGFVIGSIIAGLVI